MDSALSTSSVIHLRDFVAGRVDLPEFHRWLLSIEWTEGVSEEERHMLGVIRGLLIDTEEGEDEHELRSAIITLLQSATGSSGVSGSESDVNSGVRVTWHVYAWEESSPQEWELDLVGDADTLDVFVVDTAVTAA
jgi:hypothetical protein